jgi:hypothetical protein
MHNARTAPLLALGLKLLTLSALASDSLAQAIDDNWYQVEVIVFSQSMGLQDTQETWPVDIALAYPPGTVLLRDPNAIVIDDPEPADEFLTVPPPGAELNTLPLEDNNQELLAPDALNGNSNSQFSGSAEVQGPALGEGTEAGASSADAQTAELQQAPELEQPFMLLPADELELTAAAKRIAHAGRTRVLTHIAWRQALPDRNQTKEVVITGSDQFADHFELEGTISVSLSRFIHLKTNLWLTQFYPNYGQLSGFSKWPPLPTLPAFNEPQREQAESLTFSSWQTDNQGSMNLEPLNSTLGSTGFSGPEYLVQQIILNQQSRKMRSSEIHYLDHPVIGVVATVTQVERSVVDEEVTSDLSTVLPDDQ